jgi:uncharacterized protein YceH (UPF0502 family)
LAGSSLSSAEWIIGNLGHNQESDTMTDQPVPGSSPTPPQHRWQPLSAIDRRVVGVLAEKAKTTPDIYPMSVNAICTGSNQKSNRAPLMQLELDQIEESLERLRQVGAIGMVEGYGRVQKYRHYLYEWLGVDKVELAVMTELLLRGDQTIGELRGRAARMEPIADLGALRPILDSLKAKGLVVALTPEGRGQVVSHGLYKARELEALQARYEGVGSQEVAGEEEPGILPPVHHAPAPVSAAPIRATAPVGDSHGLLAAASREIADLRNQVAQLRADFDEMRDMNQHLADEVHALKEALGG